MFTHRYRYLFILLLSVYSFLNILFTEGNRLLPNEPHRGILLGIILLLVLFIWEGNRLISNFTENINFSKVHPLVIFFLTSVIYIAILSISGSLLFHVFYPATNVTLTTKLMLGFTFRVNLFLHCIHAIVFFIEKYRSAQFESESLKKMHAEAQFEALRNQINPHFLFNSLNALTTLVHKDAVVSEKFINQLSHVYRYLLYNQDNRLVPIADEIKFIKSYIFLQNIRFGETLDIDLRIDEELNDKLIAPATLQMLVENAIKHNVVSKKEPLKIKIYNNGYYLIVENAINLKKIKPESSQIGLENIKKRYQFLSSDKPVEISADHVFKVKIPIIEVV